VSEQALASGDIFWPAVPVRRSRFDRLEARG